MQFREINDKEDQEIAKVWGYELGTKMTENFKCNFYLVFDQEQEDKDWREYIGYTMASSTGKPFAIVSKRDFIAENHEKQEWSEIIKKVNVLNSS